MTLLRPTRRDLLRLAAAAPAFALTSAMPFTIPSTARAQMRAPDADNPGFFHFHMGQARLSIISDGWFSQPMAGQAINADEADKLVFLNAHYLDLEQNYAHTNHLYVELGATRLLVDVGSGGRFGTTTGKLISNLEAAGIDPAGITHVAITHAHPDHIWGVRDDFDEPLFADAEYIIGGDEYAYWMQDDLVNRVPETGQQFVVGAVNALTTEGLEWTMAAPEQEIAPGIRMIATPGHTRGHMSVEIESDGHSLIALGDCMTQAFLNFAHPEWVAARDDLPDVTVATRRRLLDRAAADRVAVLGYHFPFPGIGHVKPAQDAYTFIPALWRF